MCIEYIPGFNNLILVAPHTFKEKLLTSLKNFVDGRKWKPFLKKNTQEENEEAVG